MDKQKITRVESVETKDDEIHVHLIIDKKEFAENFISMYNSQQAVQKEVVPIIVKEILDEYKDKIKQDVLTGVNWAELVRSDIAKKVIQEAARSY